MKRTLSIAVVFCLLAGVNAQESKPAQKPVKVFILAGQSNMEGQGVVEMDHPEYYNSGKGNLVNTMKDPKKAHLFKHLKDEKGRWTVRSDVKISFREATSSAITTASPSCS